MLSDDIMIKKPKMWGAKQLSEEGLLQPILALIDLLGWELEMLQDHAKLLEDVDDLIEKLSRRTGLAGVSKDTITHNQLINEKASLIYTEMEQMSLAAQHVARKNEDKVFIVTFLSRFH